MKAWVHILIGLPITIIIGHLINGHDGVLLAVLGYIVGMLVVRS